MYTVEALIAALMNDKNGRHNPLFRLLYLVRLSLVVFVPPDGRISLYIGYSRKYQHRNPSTHLEEVIATARCVVLAGVTMSPVSTPTNLKGIASNQTYINPKCGDAAMPCRGS